VSTAIGVGILVVLRTTYGAGLLPGALIGVLTLLPALAGAVAALRGRWRAAVAATVVQGLFSVIAFVVLASPYLAVKLSARDISLAALSARSAGEEIATYKYFHHTLDYYTAYQVVSDLEDPAALEQFAQQRRQFLVVTQEQWIPEIEHAVCCTIDELAAQGRLRLLRVTRKPGPQ